MGDIEGMKTVLKRHEEGHRENEREVMSFRKTIEEQRLSSSLFLNSVEAKLVEQVEHSVRKLEERIQRDTDRLWKLFDEHKVGFPFLSFLSFNGFHGIFSNAILSLRIDTDAYYSLCLCCFLAQR
jgi:hypothetical protein